MNRLFKIIELPAMKMASFHVTESKSPENEAWERLLLWAEPMKIFEKPSIYQVFGRNNPIPLKDHTIRGYEYLVSVPDDIDARILKTVDFPGGLYVVLQSKGLEQMQKNHNYIMEWIQSSKRYTHGYPDGYDYAHLPSLELEHHIDPFHRTRLIDYYFPIKEILPI